MQKPGLDAAAHKVRSVFAITGTLLAAAAACAQPAPSADQAPSDAARRAALSPYRFILQNATAPRKPAPAAAAPAAAEARRTTPPATQQASIAPSSSSPAATHNAPTPESAPEKAAASAPAPAPQAVAALSRPPVEPPPVRREIIPVRTDEPHLPAALLREQPKGTVKVRFDIQYDGSVSDVKVVSSGNRALNKPTVEAIQGWKFQPVDEVLTVETELVYKFDEQ